jgi:hypothetical protein
MELRTDNETKPWHKEVQARLPHIIQDGEYSVEIEVKLRLKPTVYCGRYQKDF